MLCLLDGGGNTSKTAGTLGIADFARAVPILDLGSDAQGYVAFAGCADFLNNHRFGEAEAIAELNGVGSLFEPNPESHVCLGQDCAAVTVIHDLATGCSADAERRFLDGFKMLRFDLMFQGPQPDRLTGLATAWASSRLFACSARCNGWARFRVFTAAVGHTFHSSSVSGSVGLIVGSKLSVFKSSVRLLAGHAKFGGGRCHRHWIASRLRMGLPADAQAKTEGCAPR